MTAKGYSLERSVSNTGKAEEKGSVLVFGCFDGCCRPLCSATETAVAGKKRQYVKASTKKEIV